MGLLRTIIREAIIRESWGGARNTAPIPAKDAREIYAELGKLLKLKLPTVRFTKGIKEVEVDDIEIKINLDRGSIIVTTWGYSIPNADRVEKYLQKHFSKVVNKRGSIFASGYGEPFSNEVSLSDPSNKKPLPKIFPKDLKGMKSEREIISKILSPIDGAAHDRRVQIVGKNPHLLNAQVVTRINRQHKIVKIQDQFYLDDGFGYYWIKNEKEGIDLAKMLDLVLNIRRALEVGSWNVSKMGPEGSFD